MDTLVHGEMYREKRIIPLSPFFHSLSTANVAPAASMISPLRL